MSLRINNNIASVNGHRNMTKNDMAVSKSLERLSSGLRINRAADDAAGLVISEQMRAQLTGINQAMNNGEQAVTMVQTAEGALDEVNSLLSKARQLALHSANTGVNSTDQLIADQGELDNIIGSISRISATTQFGTKKLLDGSLSAAVSNTDAVSSVSLGGDYQSKLSAGTVVKGFHTLRITAMATQSVTDLGMANSADIWSGGTLALASGSEAAQKAFTMTINGSQITVSSGTTKNQFVQQLNSLGAKMGFTATTTGSIVGGATTGSAGNITLTSRDFGSTVTFDVQFVSGATGASTLALANTTNGTNAAATLYLYSGANGVGGTATSGATQTLSFTASGNGLRLVTGNGSMIELSTAIGANTGAGLTSGYYMGAINGTGGGATFQIGANVGQTATVTMNSTDSSQLGIGGSGTYSTLDQLKGSSLISGNANEALKVIDKAITDITSMRGAIGAFQSATLESTLNSLRVTNENLTAAESTIRDVDFAGESAKFTKNNILMQAATAMMAQANQLPQGVLKLLG